MGSFFIPPPPSLSSGGKEQIQQRRFVSTVCAPFLSLTVYHRDVQPRTHVVQHVTHDAGKKKKGQLVLSSTAPPLLKAPRASDTHVLPSKQICGPTTSAAPLVRRMAKWSGGQTLDNLHFRSADALTETGRQAGRNIYGTRLHNIVGCCVIKAPWFWSLEHQKSKSLQKLEYHLDSVICSFGCYQHFLNISLKSVHNLLLFC